MSQRFTFWLDRGWLRWRPGDPALAWVGTPEAPAHPEHGGYRRILGFGSGWIELLTLTHRHAKITWDPDDMEGTMRQEIVPR
jgi:hypothetical protein